MVHPPLFARQVYANFIQSKPTLENFKQRIQFVRYAGLDKRKTQNRILFTIKFKKVFFRVH
jgi:hypothetical protein